MASIVLKNIQKIYPDGYTAVKNLDLEIRDKEFMILVGPSGCGKSTTLRMIAGLEEISGGELLIDGKRMNEEEAKDRDIAMVFQSYALYPHMTVYDNMAFALKLRKMPKKEISRIVGGTAKILNLEKLLGRKPNALSGGEKQRVAMGRAIVRKPRVFLMDEPLSNLDAMLRVQMRLELARLQKELEATIIYVTHDQTEAMTLGTRIAVMKDGEIMQVDTPENLYEHPGNLFVAGFIGSPRMNFLKGSIREEAGRAMFVTGGRVLELPPVKEKQLKRAGRGGKEVILGIRPDSIYESCAHGACYGNEIEARVKALEFLGTEASLYAEFAGTDLVIQVKPERRAERGARIGLSLDLEKAHFFDPDTKKRLIE